MAGGKRGMMRAILTSFTICLTQAAWAGEQGLFAGFEGAYQVVTLRRASDVAAPALDAPQGAIGARVIISADAITMDGAGCDKWGASPVPVDSYLAEPMLADMWIAPNDAPVTQGDARLPMALRVDCEGDYFTTLVRADDRVLAMSLQNEATLAILEKPLSETQAERLRAHLRATHFLDVEVSGAALEDATLQALRGWYDYRQAEADGAVFARIAITRNLLDSTGVWDD